MESEQFTAVILAGGRSSRMGKNKALLTIDDKTLIETLVYELNKEFSSLLIAANDKESYKYLGVPIIPDLYPGCGPLAGIQAGLRAAPGKGIFVVACDMPFVTGELARKMLGSLDKADGVVLEKDGKLEPLCSVYTKNCLPAVEDSLKAHRLKVIDFYPLVQIKILPIEKLSLSDQVDKVLYNINTPEEYSQALHYPKLKHAP